MCAPKTMHTADHLRESCYCEGNPRKGKFSDISGDNMHHPSTVPIS